MPLAIQNIIYRVKFCKEFPYRKKTASQKIFLKFYPKLKQVDADPTIPKKRTAMPARPRATAEAEKRPLKESGRIGAKTLVPKRPRMDKSAEVEETAEPETEVVKAEEMEKLKDAGKKYKRELSEISREETKLKRENDYTATQIRRQKEKCKFCPKVLKLKKNLKNSGL